MKRLGTVAVFGYLDLLNFSPQFKRLRKYQALETKFDHISKHLVVRQKYSAALFGVWKCGQTRSLVFDMLSVKVIPLK